MRKLLIKMILSLTGALGKHLNPFRPAFHSYICHTHAAEYFVVSNTCGMIIGKQSRPSLVVPTGNVSV